MKISLWALVCAVASAPAALMASDGGLSEIRPTSSSAGSYYSQDPQAPLAPSADPQALPPASECCAPTSCSNGDCDTCGGLFDPCCSIEGEPWKLFNNPCLACRGINIGGYAAASFTWNPDNPADRFNGPVTWIDRANEAQLNQLMLWIDKPTDTQGCGWDLGYRTDWMYGTDWRFATESGLETTGQFSFPKWSHQRFYGLAATQIYGEVAMNDVKVKVGEFYSPVGYEVVQTNLNFFSSLPYTFQYGEPFTHTGALATWKIDDQASVSAGVIRGWDNFGNNNPNLGLLTAYNYTFCDKSSLAIVQVISNEPTQVVLTPTQNLHRQRYLQTNVYSKPLNDCYTMVLQSDYGYQNDALVNGHDAMWYGINSYLFKKISDCTTVGIRGEWFRDQNGFRVGGFQGPTPDGSTRGLALDRVGYVGNFFEITVGLNYKFNANSMIRPMVRFDWFDGSIDPTFNPTLLKPFDGGSKNTQALIGFDYIFTY